MTSPVSADDEQLEVLDLEDTPEDFVSEEARLDFERARRRRMILVAVFVLAVVGGLGALIWGLFAAQSKGTESPKPDGKACAAKLKPVGSPNAKIKIQCIAPTGSGCHDPIIQLLKEAAKHHKDQIRVEFSDMHNMGREVLKKTVGQVCAGVVINGKVSFKIHTGGKERTVQLVGTAPANFSLQDLLDALTEVYEQTYGPLPEGPLVDLKKIPGAQSDQKSHKEAIGDAAAVTGGSPPKEDTTEKNLDLTLPPSEDLKLNATPGTSPNRAAAPAPPGKGPAPLRTKNGEAD